MSDDILSLIGPAANDLSGSTEALLTASLKAMALNRITGEPLIEGKAARLADVLEVAAQTNYRLRYLDLSGKRLRSLDLTRADLAMMNGRGLEATGTVFADCRLHHADLSNAKLWQCRFDRATLYGASLDNVRGDQAQFAGTDLSGVSARNASFYRASFAGALLNAVDLRGADLSSTDFTDATVSIVLVDDTTRLTGANLTEEQLSGLVMLDDQGQPRALQPAELPQDLAPAPASETEAVAEAASQPEQADAGDQKSGKAPRFPAPHKAPKPKS
ncbi:MAG: hypothetical protein Alpg2KO_22970 [Alphaproteobacteria bacterium]